MAKRNLQFRGFSEAQQILDALPKKLGSQTVQKVLREGAKPLVKQTKANASHSDVTGNLSRSIGVINGKGGLKGAGVYVGPRRGKGAYGKGHHGHLLEYGTAPHKIAPKEKQKLAFDGSVFGGVQHPGSAPFPFLRPAWDATNAVVLKKIGDGFKEILLSDFKNVRF